MSYEGKYQFLVHPWGAKFVVAFQREDGRYYSVNTQEFPGSAEVSADNLDDLVTQHRVRTYANINAAIKAVLRIYQVDRFADVLPRAPDPRQAPYAHGPKPPTQPDPPTASSSSPAPDSPRPSSPTAPWHNRSADS